MPKDREPAQASTVHAFDMVEFENNAQRLPLLLCLDVSSSMAGEPIDTLNSALWDWTRELHDDVSLSNSVEIAIVTFGGSGVTAWQGPQPLPPGAQASPFVPAHLFQPPRLTASGVTPMLQALELTRHIIAARKSWLRQAGLQYYRPQVCLVTDGVPTDASGHYTQDWQRLAPILAADQADQRFRLYAVGVGKITEAGQQVLQGFAPRFNARLQGFPFRDLLQMMSASASAAQRGAGDELFEKLFDQFTHQRPARER